MDFSKLIINIHIEKQKYQTYSQPKSRIMKYDFESR